MAQSGRYLGSLSTILGIQSPLVYMEVYLLRKVNPINRSQYFEGLIFTVTRVKKNTLLKSKMTDHLIPITTVKKKNKWLMSWQIIDILNINHWDVLLKIRTHFYESNSET